MVPRYALGNWWSRYYEYSEQSYMELMNRFEEERVPFTVAVIDMDWHIVHVDEKYGSGWTGYSCGIGTVSGPGAFPFLAACARDEDNVERASGGRRAGLRGCLSGDGKAHGRRRQARGAGKL
ncbi:MAG: TIM-barrel domain-containing protein [Lachnospiraceae bacterium]